MIAHLRGSLIEKRDDGTVVIDAGGVGYMVTVSSATLAALPGVGREAAVHVFSHASQDGGLQLYGFQDAEERGLFETLLSVQGVGPKVAVAILSGLPAAELRRAIGASDVARLTQIRGVGRKTAERLCVELRDKVGPVSGGGRGGREGGGAGGLPQGKLGDVYGALMSLGYKVGEFEALVAKMDTSEPTADLIRKALSALRRK